LRTGRSLSWCVSAVSSALMLAIAGQAFLASTGSLSVALAASCGSAETADWSGFRGYSRPPANYSETPEGVSANIRVEGANVCTGPPPGGDPPMSTAWVGIHDQHDSTGTIHYFQAGYMFDGTCMDRFIEYNITDNSSLWQRSFQGICAASPDYVTSR